jgi:hypothetical protein
MSITQPTLSVAEISDITDYVNAYRQKNQAPPLIWDETIAKISQQWSFHLVSDGAFVHSRNPLYGENLAYFQGYGTNVVELVKKAIDGWYNEISQYDFNNPGFSESTGHFTCLVWVSSSHYGLGISINENTNAVDIVLNTSPHGNVIGEFQQNVLPTTGNIPPTPPSTPIPTPTPMPTPMPIPTPYKLPPLIVANIVNRLKSIIYELQTRKRKSIIFVALNEIIDKLLINTNYVFVNEMYNIMVMIQQKQTPSVIITAINKLIQEL